MKAIVAALLLSLASPLLAQNTGGLSSSGLFEVDLTNSGKLVLFAPDDRSIFAYVYDRGGQSYGTGSAVVASSNNAFSLTTNSGVDINGFLQPNHVSANYNGTPFLAPRTPNFYTSPLLVGRYVGTAISTSSNTTYNLHFLIDGQSNLFYSLDRGNAVEGGFGSLNSSYDGTSGSFSTTSVGGVPVQGNFTNAHGIFSGTLTRNNETFNFFVLRESVTHHLANISTRGPVTATPTGQLIGGFIISGGPKFVLVRAIGPALAQFGVNPVLANPKVDLYVGQTIIASNDDWKSNANKQDIVDSGLAPSYDKEAALLVRLREGSYTAVVSGADGGAGVALVEVYEFDRD